MKPFGVLIIAFIISLTSVKFTRGNYNIALAGRIAMSVMLVFTAMAHFKFTQGMTMMLPGFVPHPKKIVWLTGIIEIAAAVGLLIPGLRVITAWLLIVFFILILPANIYASINKVNFQEATFDGNGLAYLWFRIPLQIFFILWVYFSSIKIA
tara:strand:+ start:21645 stop:22100 length:456 start_codon:yes stop_codon:yes gene_type:complete